MENSSRELQEEVDRKREFHRVIEKCRNMPKSNEEGPSSSNTQQPRDREQELELQQRAEIENDSDQTIAVPAINSRTYFGAASVRYIHMETASKLQYDDQWDLEETVRQVYQKFSPDLRIIADETTNDEKLLKTLVWTQNAETWNKYRTSIRTTKKTYHRGSESCSMMIK